MAKDTADQQTAEFDYSGLYNEDNPTESLSGLDLGDELEPTDTTTEEPEEEAPVEEPESEDTEEEDDAASDDAEEGGEEPDDSAADDEAESTEEEAPQEETPKPKQPFIPKSRFDQRTAQLRAAERELEETRRKLLELETAKQKAEREANTLSEEQIQQKMTEANTALLEGDTEKASKLQSEVFAALRQGTQAVEQTTGEKIDPNKIVADVRDQMTFEQTLERIYSEYPALNENSDQFDEAISQEAVELQSFYFKQGYTRAEATERAVLAVSRLHGLESTAPQADAPKVNKQAEMAKRAQTEAKKSKVEKARKAPPSSIGAGGHSESSTDHMDVDSLTVEDWAALPDSVRARLLGDTL
ncbi:hypothetical protein [Halomonas sp. 707B3]|uniref:hypothetical protein n=1 Tax=Halomonas sp. 707B3 TaxID=1681043 RepID=UPI0020A0F281|nr:hypothetical protein [Halomonas sp. 707B3]MCP1316859.1 hypothetical protein [Halomonas sp. 707B3]